jgi:hypothetical protein
MSIILYILGMVMMHLACTCAAKIENIDLSHYGIKLAILLFWPVIIIAVAFVAAIDWVRHSFR